jgi:C1A family cysteine protease
MKTFLAFALAGAVSAFEEVDLEFMRFVVQYNKEYATVEQYETRKENFRFIHEEIKRFNQEESTSVHGHNYMSDWTREEYQKMLGLNGMKLKDTDRPAYWPGPSENQAPGAYPASYDWRSYGVVNPVKNQGNCGSCYSFSTTAVMESNYAIYHGTLWNLSEQQIVDCSSGYGNGGCDGGWYYWGWDYAHVTPVATTAAYPYVSGTTQVAGTCKYAVGSGKVYANTQYSCYNNSASIQNCLYNYVQAVAIDAGSSYFQTYTSGVLTNTVACGTSINHAVTAIGWGNNATAGNYWIVRNSWGTGWGNAGYVYIGWGTSPGVCGINDYVAFATV